MRPPRAPMRPHSFLRDGETAEQVGLHVECIESAHVARRIDAVKIHGVHAASLAIVQPDTL
jgi:hypothetical protein